MFNMKIGVLCNHFGYGGGTERYVRDLVSGIRKVQLSAQSDSTLHGVDDGQKSGIWMFAEKFDDFQQSHEVNQIKLGGGWLPRKLRGLSHRSTFATERRKLGLDKIISVSATVPGDIAVCGFTIQGEMQARQLKLSWLMRQRLKLEQKGFQDSKTVVAHSAMIADELQRLYGLSSAKVALLYPPVDTQEFFPVMGESRFELRRSLGLDEKKMVVLFPSTGHRRKGLSAVLKWLEETKLPVQLLVVGSDPGGLPEKALYLGYRRSIAALYQAADFSMLNSAYEPFGLAGVESILCGTPTFQTTMTGCTEVLSRDACSVFQANDIQQLDSVMKNAFMKFEAQEHRIAEPKKNISYDCSLEGHAREIMKL